MLKAEALSSYDSVFQCGLHYQEKNQHQDGTFRHIVRHLSLWICRELHGDGRPTGLLEPEALHLGRFLNAQIPHRDLPIKLHTCRRNQNKPSLYGEQVIGCYTESQKEGKSKSNSRFLSLTLSNMPPLMGKQL